MRNSTSAARARQSSDNDGRAGTAGDEPKPRPFAMLPHDYVADPRLTALDLRVVLALLFWARADSKCWPSVKSIAARVHMSDRSVQTSLRCLEHHGYIRIEDAPDKSTHRLIVLLWLEGKDPLRAEPVCSVSPRAKALDRRRSRPVGGETGFTPPVKRASPPGEAGFTPPVKPVSPEEESFLVQEEADKNQSLEASPAEWPTPPGPAEQQSDPEGKANEGYGSWFERGNEGEVNGAPEPGHTADVVQPSERRQLPDHVRLPRFAGPDHVELQVAKGDDQLTPGMVAAIGQLRSGELDVLNRMPGRYRRRIVAWLAHGGNLAAEALSHIRTAESQLKAPPPQPPPPCDSPGPMAGMLDRTMARLTDPKPLERMSKGEAFLRAGMAMDNAKSVARTAQRGDPDTEAMLGRLGVGCDFHEIELCVRRLCREFNDGKSQGYYVEALSEVRAGRRSPVALVHAYQMANGRKVRNPGAAFNRALKNYERGQAPH